jgi:hypothetical protein
VIVAANAVEALISYAENTNEEGLLFAMGTLANLTSDPSAHERFLPRNNNNNNNNNNKNVNNNSSNNSSSEIVIRSLSCADVEVQRYAAAVLANLAFCPELQTSIVEAGIFFFLSLSLSLFF